MNKKDGESLDTRRISDINQGSKNSQKIKFDNSFIVSKTN